MLVSGALVAVLLVAGCGSTGASKQTLAAQDHLVQLSNRLEALHSHYLATQRRLALARRAVARVRRGPVPARRKTSAATTAAARASQPVRQGNGFEMSIVHLCDPIRLKGAKGPRRHALQALAARRRQALYYLNLSCPSAGA